LSWEELAKPVNTQQGYHRALEGRRQALCEPLAGQCRTAAALPAGESSRIICRSGTLRFAGVGAKAVKREGTAVLSQSAPAQGTQRAVTTRRKIRPDLSEKKDRQLTVFPTLTRRKNRHDKDRMNYLTKREIEKEFHTPRFAKGGRRLWYLASRGNRRHGNRCDGGPTEKDGTPILVGSRIPIPPAAAGPLALCRQRRKVS